jgi:PhoPQ-activated pathogenicity-related protein
MTGAGLLILACGPAAEREAAVAPTSTPAPEMTPLDAYVAAPDPAYGYQLSDTIEQGDHQVFVLHLTSQTWLSEAEVDRPLWDHWLTVVRPEEVASDIALLYLGGGDNGDPAPTEVSPMLLTAATQARAIVAELRMIPNQPLRFVGDPYGDRTEDEIIAYAWKRFLTEGDPKWLPRLPMTKAAVRAMDTITDFCAGAAAGELPIRRFVVAGGSKRGWATWTTAAVDDRVVAVVPFVIDLLNLEESFAHHYRAYGYWAPAVADYEREGIMEWQGTPEYRRLQEIVEPFQYRARLTMPKLIINATGDQFFLPDSSRFYFDQLPDEKHLRYVPNSEHSLGDTDAAETLVAFLQTVVMDTPRPDFDWSLEGDTLSVTVDPNNPPYEVNLWQATNPDARDFRVDTIGRSWTSRPLTADQDKYAVALAEPAAGWNAYLIELTFPGPGEYPLKLTTGVNVVPETLPYEYPPPRDVN